MKSLTAPDLPPLMDRYSLLLRNHDALIGHTGSLSVATCMVDTADLQELKPSTVNLRMRPVITGPPNWGESLISVEKVDGEDDSEDVFTTTIRARVNDQMPEPRVYRTIGLASETDDERNARPDTIDMTPALTRHMISERRIVDCDFPASTRATFVRIGSEIGVEASITELSGERETDSNRVEQLHLKVLHQVLRSGIPKDVLAVRAEKNKRLLAVASDASAQKSVRYWAMRSLHYSDDQINEILGDEFVKNLKKPYAVPRITSSDSSSAKVTQAKLNEGQQGNTSAGTGVELSSNAETAVAPHDLEDLNERIKELRRVFPIPTRVERQIINSPSLIRAIDEFDLLVSNYPEIVGDGRSLIVQGAVSTQSMNPSMLSLDPDVEFIELDSASKGENLDMDKSAIVTLYRGGDDGVLYRSVILSDDPNLPHRSEAKYLREGDVLYAFVNTYDEQGRPTPTRDDALIGIHTFVCGKAITSPMASDNVREVYSRREAQQRQLDSGNLSPTDKRRVQDRLGKTKL